MFTKTLLITAALLATGAQAFADWDNPTFDRIADGATYFSPAEPCAVKISKASSKAEIYVTYTQNPVFWFPGFDRYRDATGIDRWANRCPRKDEVRVFFCPSHLPQCESSAGEDKDHTLELTDAGKLVESSLTADLHQTPYAVLDLYSDGVAQGIACHTNERAQEAATYLTTVRDTNLDKECQFKVVDADRGVNIDLYKASCVDRNTLKVYVANIRDRLFVDEIIALTALSFEGADGRCLREAEELLTGSGYGGHNFVAPKCAKAELSAAIDSLNSMAIEAAKACDGARAANPSESKP